MASETDENSHVGLAELEELEAIEIDEALLRELLEEQDVGVADVECLEESVHQNNNKRMMDEKQEDDQKQQKTSYSEQREGCNIEFELMNNDNNNQQVMMNWYPDDDDDMVGMLVDFGYGNNAELFSSQACEGLVCYEASYGCSLWDDLVSSTY